MRSVAARLCVVELRARGARLAAARRRLARRWAVIRLAAAPAASLRRPAALSHRALPAPPPALRRACLLPRRRSLRAAASAIYLPRYTSADVPDVPADGCPSVRAPQFDAALCVSPGVLWRVPWRLPFVAGVLACWALAFLAVGHVLLPAAAGALGLNRELLADRGLALYALATDAAECAAGAAVLALALRCYAPLPPGWFALRWPRGACCDVNAACFCFPLISALADLPMTLSAAAPTAAPAGWDAALAASAAAPTRVVLVRRA